MMSNMFADFKSDIMQSVTETIESRINEWYEENDYSAEDEPVAHNNTNYNCPTILTAYIISPLYGKVKIS